MKIIWEEEALSTNSEVLKYEGMYPGGVVLAAHRQTAGRGQKGNSWEAEPGRNLSFSAMWQPEAFAANRQFSISEAVALSVADLLEQHGIEATVKWPNDIYVGEKKICGVLIEHSVTGREINRTVSGVGINVNQTEFRSDAPNPVSMKMLTGREYDLAQLLEEYVGMLGRRLAAINSEEGKKAVHGEFCNRMWRFDGGCHLFRDREGEYVFMGEILGVSTIGMMRVRNVENGEEKEYAFKEVEFLL